MAAGGEGVSRLLSTITDLLIVAVCMVALLFARPADLADFESEDQ